jgi:Zn-dependent protease with chaperone function
MSSGSGTRSLVGRTLRAREQQRRRAILLGIGTLIVLGTSPVFGHHVLSGTVPIFVGRDHIAGVCLIALHELLAPVHLGLHIILTLGLAYALLDRVRAVVTARQTLQALDSHAAPAGSPIARAAVRAGLSGDDVLVVSGLPTPAFTAGWWHPRVYVASEIDEVLNEAQLTAVLTHEAAHLARRDPLRLSVLRFLAHTLFYLPTFRRLAEDAADEAEILADDAAARAQPLVLAETLVVLATSFAERSRERSSVAASIGAFAVGFQSLGLIERRVRRLMGEDVPIRSHVTTGSLAGAGALLTVIALSGLIMAHPLAAEAGTGAHATSASHTRRGVAARAEHCHHQGEMAIGHLFCLGFHHHAAGTPCPHIGHGAAVPPSAAS